MLFNHTKMCIKHSNNIIKIIKINFLWDEHNSISVLRVWNKLGFPFRFPLVSQLFLRNYRVIKLSLLFLLLSPPLRWPKFEQLRVDFSFRDETFQTNPKLILYLNNYYLEADDPLEKKMTKWGELCVSNVIYTINFRFSNEISGLIMSNLFLDNKWF